VREIVTTIASVAMQISAVAAAIAPIAAQITGIGTLRSAIAAKVTAIFPRLPIPAVGAVASDVAPVCAPISIVGAEVAFVAANVMTVTAEIATIGANIARIAVHVAGSLGRDALRPPDGGRAGGERDRHAKSHQCVAKHCEVLQGSVGAATGSSRRSRR
jgi:hypothetical protein